mgnify:CR=1 FL=1
MRGGRYYDLGTGPKPSSRWAFTNRRPCGHSGLVRAEKGEVMLFEIKHRFTDEVLFSLECGSLKLCVIAAVKAKTYLDSANLGGADLGGADLGGADLRGADLRGADLRGADLGGADLRGADLRGADLRGADLGGADLIDGGQDARGYRFYAWRDKEGVIVYRAGCHEWRSIDEALAWYGDEYPSNGDRIECVARLNLLHSEALRRWPVAVEVAA